MLNMIIKLVVLAFTLLAVAFLIPGIHISGFWSAIVAAIIVVLINLFLKPILMFFALPINILTLGIATLFINALLFLLVGYLVPGVEISSFWSAFFGAILLSLFTVLLSKFLP